MAHGGSWGLAGDRPLHLDVVPGDEACAVLPDDLETAAAGALQTHHRCPGERVLPAALARAEPAAPAASLEPRLPLPRVLPHLSRADAGAARGLVPARHVRRAH